MDLLHEKSAECAMEELDLFSAPMTWMSIEEKQKKKSKKKYIDILPVLAITNRGPIEFFIHGDGEKYLDLNDTSLHLRLKTTKANGSKLAQDAVVGLINYPLNIIFTQCNIVLGDRPISQASSTHPYRAMIETLLNFSEDTLKSRFSTGLFYKDMAGTMDSIVINNGPNKGLVWRTRFSVELREFHLMRPLHTDIFSVRNCF